MIALVKFEKDLVIERSEAESLKLTYEEKLRFGKGCSYNNSIQPMSDSDFYTDELFVVEEDGKVKYYTNDTKTKEVSDYCRYDIIPNKDWVFIPKENNMVDLEHFALNCKYPYTIVKCVKSEEPTISNLSSLVNQIEEKFQHISKDLDMFSNQQLNQKVNVHVGGGLIVTYNELKLKEDSCTDELQVELNEGWRIIAVCVQPDQRRPDYILGRYNPNLGMSGYAQR